MSLAKLKLGNHKDSLDDLKKSQELFKEDSNKEFLSIFDDKEINHVLRIYELNNDLKAVETILKFMKKNKINDINYKLGILYFKNGDFYNAVSYLLEVYEVDNKNKDCILYIGKAKLALKDYKSALLDFKKCKELDSTDEIQKLIKTREENLKSK